MNIINWEDLTATEIVAMFNGKEMPALNDNDFAILISKDDEQNENYDHPEQGEWQIYDGIEYRLYVA